MTLLASGSVVAQAGVELTYSQTGSSTWVAPVASGSLAAVIDPAVYDLQKLATLEASSKGNLPLEVSYTGARPTLPGLTWTSAHAGYVTPSSARTFGTTLRTGTAAGISRIALPGPTTVTPLYVMHTVTLKSIAIGTQSDLTSWNIVNVDDVNKWESNLLSYPGDELRLSLPDGHYAMRTLFPDSTGAETNYRLVVMPFTVSGDTVVTVDAGTATALVGVTTPRPATLGYTGYEVNSLDAAGNVSKFGIANGTQGQLFVSPTPAGGPLKMRVQANFHLESDQTAADPYTCDLAYQAASIAKNEHFVASPGSVAAVNARFYSDGVTTRANFVMTPALRSPRNDVSAATFGLEFPVTLGTSRTQYTSAGIYFQPLIDTGIQPGGGVISGPYQSFSPGSRPTLNFLRGPLHPGAAVPTKPAWSDTSPADAPPCALCRIDDKFLFGLYPLVDNGSNAGTRNDGDINWTLSANGTQISSGKGDLGQGTGIEVDPQVNDYSLNYVLARPNAGTSTRTDTTWTFRSGPKTGTTSALVSCDDVYVGTYATGCRTQNLLTTDFQLPESLQDSEAVGPTTAQISVGQVPGAAVHPIRIFSAQVSFNAGVTWQSTTTVAGSGHGTYQVAYDNPTGATAASLRVYARDSAGSTITQTIDRAYTVRGAGAP